MKTDTEEEQRLAMVESMKDWACAWVVSDWPMVSEICKPGEARVRKILVGFRRQVRQFAEYEGPYLPSRVLYRRMVEMDDIMIRRIRAAMSDDDCARLDAEAKASVKKHGSVEDAHRARLIRDMFGIPRL